MSSDDNTLLNPENDDDRDLKALRNGAVTMRQHTAPPEKMQENYLKNWQASTANKLQQSTRPIKTEGKT